MGYACWEDPTVTSSMEMPMRVLVSTYRAAWATPAERQRSMLFSGVETTRTGVRCSPRRQAEDCRASPVSPPRALLLPVSSSDTTAVALSVFGARGTAVKRLYPEKAVRPPSSAQSPLWVKQGVSDAAIQEQGDYGGLGRSLCGYGER